MVKKFITNLDSSKAYGPDGIAAVVVLKNCEPELSHMLTELLNMCPHFIMALQKIMQ